MTSRTLRVCLISREYPPETGWGGIATFTRHLAHGLQDNGHHVEVVSLSKDVDKVVDDDGIRVHRVNEEWMGKSLGSLAMCMPYSRYVLVATTALYKKFLELHKQEPFDVIDTPELLAEGFWPALSRVAPLTIRLYTPHSKFIKEGLHNVTQSFDHEFIASLERVAMLSADVITSPSLDLREFVADDLGYDIEQIKIVRNPIDPNQFSPEGPVAIAKTDKTRVLFVGRLEERKGIHYLIEAIGKIVAKEKNVEFVVIGDDTKTAAGQRSVKAELNAKVAADGTAGYIRFIDRIPLTELPAYYRSADICVVPSVYDNSPYTCLEAMACGRPVVGTSGGGTKEYVLHNESGLIVEPRDPDALANALLTLIQDRELRERLAVQARQRVMDHFQRKEIARQTTELYELAAQSFKERTRSSMYLKSPDKVLEDATFMMKTFDKMIYDTLYRHSYRFRIRHWMRFLQDRPGLFTAKLTLKVTDLMSKLTGSRIAPLNKFQTWLSTEIKRKSMDKSLANLDNS